MADHSIQSGWPSVHPPIHSAGDFFVARPKNFQETTTGHAIVVGHHRFRWTGKFIVCTVCAAEELKTGGWVVDDQLAKIKTKLNRPPENQGPERCQQHGTEFLLWSSAFGSISIGFCSLASKGWAN